VPIQDKNTTASISYSEQLKELQEKLAQYEQREQELQEREARLQMAMDATQLGTWDFLPMTGEINLSDECKKIYGLAADTPIDLKIFTDHTYPDDRDYVKLEIRKAMDPAISENYDSTFRIIRFDDHSIRWVKAKGKVYFNNDLQADRFIGTIVDITERKLAKESIARSEKLFKSVALSIPKSLIIVIDKEHRFVTIEGDLMVKMGYDSKNYEGKHPGEVFSSEEYETTKHLYERVMAGEKFSVERKGENGDIYMVHFIPLTHEDGEIYAGLIIVLDISELKIAEEKNAKLAAIVDSSDDAIISKTLDGIITSWNDSAERTFGYKAEEMIGQSILKIIPEDRQEEEAEILARLRQGQRVEHFETIRLKKNKQLLDISLTISPVKDPQGNIIGLSKIARDITEKKQEESRKNDFIAMVSHELKTPLTSIRSYIQVLLAKAKNEGDSFKINALTRADVQSKKMTSLIQDFLNLAKLEEGKISIHRTIFDLQELIEEIAGDAQFFTSSHIFQIQDCGKISINADRDKIGQVLMNLLSNAIKYSPKGGNILIGCKKNDGKVEIFVNDEGIGISPVDQTKLFDRFYRVKNDQIKTVSGFGIGLYLVSEILRYHDSKIEVESEEGVGSKFYFKLDIQ
jgi:PAS domain S-box-containing protein